MDCKPCGLTLEGDSSIGIALYLSVSSWFGNTEIKMKIQRSSSWGNNYSSICPFHQSYLQISRWEQAAYLGEVQYQLLLDLIQDLWDVGRDGWDSSLWLIKAHLVPDPRYTSTLPFSEFDQFPGGALVCAAWLCCRLTFSQVLKKRLRRTLVLWHTSISPRCPGSHFIFYLFLVHLPSKIHSSAKKTYFARFRFGGRQLRIN